MVLKLERSWLHQRINQRVDTMLHAGLEQEVRQLVAEHGELSRTAQQAVGYAEVLQYLRGECSAEALPDLIKAHTRQFARRQEIWFRGLGELRGLEVRPDSRFEELVDQLVEVYSVAPQPIRGQHA